MLDFHWFLPTYGDSRDIIGGGRDLPAGAAGGDRPASLDYLTQVSSAAEQLGFQSALVPSGAWSEDAWVTTAMLVQSTRRLKFLVSMQPGLMSPTLAAQMAATFQWQSRGRLLLNVVTGAEAHEQRAFGDFLDEDERYERCEEFLTIVRRLWSWSGPVSFRGRHVSVEEARLQRRPDPAPPLYFGGSPAAEPAAGQVAARHADVYLTRGEPVPAVAEKLAWIRRTAKDVGRPMRFGIRLHVITRDTSDAAWAEAQRLLDRLDPQAVARVRADLRRSESEGGRRMLDLHGGSAEGLLVAPNLWAGVGLARGGAGTALVGSHLEVADRIEEYADLGISEFVFSGYPHLEEAYWFGEGVLPILRDRGLWSHPDRQGTDGAGGEGSEGMVPFAVA